MPTILILLHKYTVLSDDKDSKSLVRFLLLWKAQKDYSTSLTDNILYVVPQQSLSILIRIKQILFPPSSPSPYHPHLPQ